MESIERRRAERYPMRLEGAVWLKDGSAHDEGRASVRDLSALGAYVESSDRRPDSGTDIVLCLNWPVKTNGSENIVRATGRTLRVELLSHSFGLAIGFDSSVHFSERCRPSNGKPVDDSKVPAIFAPPPMNREAFQYFDRLRKVLAFVREFGLQNISLVRCARVAAMERSYFSVFFREKVGITFRDWVRELRIGEARKLMAQHNYSISDVATMVGYQDLRSFERAFKKSTDLTPRDFKKLVSP